MLAEIPAYRDMSNAMIAGFTLFAVSLLLNILQCCCGITCACCSRRRSSGSWRRGVGWTTNERGGKGGRGGGGDVGGSRGGNGLAVNRSNDEEASLNYDLSESLLDNSALGEWRKVDAASTPTRTSAL